jgi:hypothetical protein
MGLVTLGLAVTDRSTRFHLNALFHRAFIHTLAGEVHDHLIVISSMMWRGNLRIRQSLHMSHFLTSAGLGFEEIACSRMCMFVVSSPLVSRSSSFTSPLVCIHARSSDPHPTYFLRRLCDLCMLLFFPSAVCTSMGMIILSSCHEPHRRARITHDDDSPWIKRSKSRMGFSRAWSNRLTGGRRRVLSANIL